MSGPTPARTAASLAALKDRLTRQDDKDCVAFLRSKGER